MRRAIIKKIHLLSLVAAFAVLFASVCPYICEVAQASVKSHSCCPEDRSQHNQEKNNKEAEKCCDQHDQILSTKQSTDSHLDSIHYQLIAFVIKFTGNSTLQNTANFVIKGSPPGISYGKPLYIIKDSFLI